MRNECIVLGLLPPLPKSCWFHLAPQPSHQAASIQVRALPGTVNANSGSLRDVPVAGCCCSERALVLVQCWAVSFPAPCILCVSYHFVISFKQLECILLFHLSLNITPEFAFCQHAFRSPNAVQLLTAFCLTMKPLFNPCI